MNLLRIAASINGDDFTPFNESIFIKEPGLGLQLRGIKIALPLGSSGLGKWNTWI